MKILFDSQDHSGNASKRWPGYEFYCEEKSLADSFAPLPETGPLEVIAAIVGQTVYFVDRRGLQEIILCKRDKLQTVPSPDGRTLYLSHLRGRPLSIVSLSRQTKDSSLPKPSGSVLVWRAENQLLGILVDQLGKRLEVEASDFSNRVKFEDFEVRTNKTGANLLDLPTVFAIGNPSAK